MTGVFAFCRWVGSCERPNLFITRSQRLVCMSRVYVDNPASVPPRYEPRRGAGGGWYYETESEDDDDILQELIQLISEQILPGMDEESLTEDLLIEEVEQELSERAEQYKGEIRKAVDSIMTEKLSMDRVYVNSEDEVPEGYQPMRDDVGDLYYEVRDAPHIDSGRTSKDEDPCWEGYVQVGMKEGEDGEMVPNCVPEEDVDD